MKYDAADTPGEWAIIIISMTISFIVAWYLMQYIYTPTPRSESPGILKLYKEQGCTLEPDFIPANILVWESGKFKYIPFDSFEHEIVLFCP